MVVEFILVLNVCLSHPRNLAVEGGYRSAEGGTEVAGVVVGACASCSRDFSREVRWHRSCVQRGQPDGLDFSAASPGSWTWVPAFFLFELYKQNVIDVPAVVRLVFLSFI